MPDPIAFTLGTLLGLIAGLLSFYFWWSSRRQKQDMQLSKLEAELAAANKQTEHFQQELQAEKTSQDLKEDRMLQLTKELGHMSADYENLTVRMQERGKDMNEMQEHFSAKFEVLANRIMTQNTEHLTTHNRDQLNQMLVPLKEKLDSFEKKVTDTYEKESRERFHLKKEIEQMALLNQRMSDEAKNLTKALKGDSKVQGNWGEMVLERVLESSGLRKGEEYSTQQSFENENGKRFQPDVIVRLPEQRHIIIDAKVSLTAYERFASSDQEGEQLSYIKQHLDSVLGHVKGLSQKYYQDLTGINSPDFVLLFLPIEAAFSLALQAQPDLFAQAWDRKIVIVSPTTLLATLRTVSSIWKLERQNRNAQEIARQGGLLYDRIVSFMGEMEKIGKHLDQASRTHDDAMRKLRDGKGNLTSRAEKLRELGVKNNKQLNVDSSSSNGPHQEPES